MLESLRRVTLRPLVLLTPSLAAAVELPRRLASTGRALAGVYPMKPLDLARALAEPVLLGKGLLPWTSGHDALLASRLLAESGGAGLRLPEGTPRAPVASALARTLTALRRGGIAPERLAALVAGAPHGIGRRPPPRLAQAPLPRLPRRARGPDGRPRHALCRRARGALARAVARGGRGVGHGRPGARSRRGRVRGRARGGVARARAASRAAAVPASRVLPRPARRAGRGRGRLERHAPRTPRPALPAGLARSPARGPLRGEPRRKPRGGRRRGRARHRAGRGGRGAVDRPTAAARGRARRELRGHGGRSPAARDLRPALHRPPLPPRHSAPPAPFAALALRSRGALAAAPLPLPRAGTARGDGVPDLRPRAVRRAPGSRRAASSRALGPDEPRGRDRLRPQSLDPGTASVGRGRARGRGVGEGRRPPRAALEPRGRRGGAPACRGAAGRDARQPRRRGHLGGVGREAAHRRRPVDRPRARPRRRAGDDRRPRRPRVGGRSRVLGRGGAGPRGALRVGAPAARASRERRRPRGRPRRDGRHALPRGRDPRPRRRGLSGGVPAGSLSPGFGARSAPNPESGHPESGSPAGARGIHRRSLSRTRQLKSPQGLFLPALSLRLFGRPWRRPCGTDQPGPARSPGSFAPGGPPKSASWRRAASSTARCRRRPSG